MAIFPRGQGGAMFPGHSDGRVAIAPSSTLHAVVSNPVATTIHGLHRPQAVAPIMPATAGGLFKALEFVISDWQGPTSDAYKIQIAHNWGLPGVGVYFIDEMGKHIGLSTVNLSDDITAGYVPAAPDLRFNGVMVVFTFERQQCNG